MTKCGGMDLHTCCTSEGFAQLRASAAVPGLLPGAREGLCCGPLLPHPATQAPLVQEPLLRAAGEPEGVGPDLQGARVVVAVCEVSGLTLLLCSSECS